MVKPKSALNDNSIDLLVEIARMTGNPSTPQLVEAALRAYMRELRQQAEYAAQPDATAAPSTDLVGD